MVIDTSALIAILLDESEAARLIRAIATGPLAILGAPTLVETGAVMLAKKGGGGGVALDALIQRMGITIEPMSYEAAQFARAAYGRYGKGVGSPGVLNYGDCLSYGVARALGEPLLFKGNDFAGTDVAKVEY